MGLKDIGAKNDMPRGWASKNKVIYNMWKHMLYRCYCNPEDKNYKHYKDVTCHPDFLLLSNFVKWIEQEPNYPLLVEDPGCNKWSIDKDSIIPGNKEYVPGKIRLMLMADNSRERNRRYDYTQVKPFIRYKPPTKGVIAINSLDNTILYFSSCKDAHNYGFTDTSKCCRGFHKFCKGYKMFYATDLLGVMNYLYKGETI